jgi:hypothetical protein
MSNPWRTPNPVANLPWTELKFDLTGLQNLRRVLGFHSSTPNLFLTRQAHFEASDIAWLAAGTHSDGNHAQNSHEFHPMYMQLYNDTGNAGKLERKALIQKVELLVYDLVRDIPLSLCTTH